MRIRRPAAEHLWLEAADRGSVLLHLDVDAGAVHSRVMGVRGRRLKLQVQGGRGDDDEQADRNLVRFLAHALALATAQVTVVASSRRGRKTVRCAGVAKGRCLLALAPRRPVL